MSTAAILGKRRPGRPRRADSAATTATPETTTEPVSIEDSADMSEPVTETTTDTATAPVAKRRPGRPKGSKNKPKMTAPTATAPTGKRGPGRPKGSKNKPKTTEPETTATATATAPTVKRGPGRPRKNPEATATATAPVAKRRPGRPKGSKNKPKTTEPEATATAPTAHVVKRGPGRPRKNPEATATAPVTKRGPGRPKGSKNKPKTTEPVAKRGPGRPRKDESTAPTVVQPKAIKTTGGVVRKVLDNPFKAGDTVLIPAGSIFTSSAPTAKGRQVVRRGHNVTVHDIIPARVQPRKSETGSNVLVRPPRIRAKGSGGYWKDITLTDKIVRLNGKNPSYEALSINLKEAAMA